MKIKTKVKENNDYVMAKIVDDEFTSEVQQI